MRRRRSLMLGLTFALALATAMSSMPAVASDPPSPAGCTPSYWKQARHFEDWQPPYDPGDRFNRYFDNAFPGMTLRQVLRQRGGGLRALGRQTVAALLNAALFTGPADPGNNVYRVNGLHEKGTETWEVIVFFNRAFPGRRARYIKWKNFFQDANRAGCPLVVGQA